MRIALVILLTAMFIGTVADATESESKGSDSFSDRAGEPVDEPSQIADAGLSDGDAGDPDPPPDAEHSETERAAVFEPPRIIEYAEADFPEAALKAGLEGEVAAELDIDENGVVVGVTIKEPAGHGFDEAAEDALYRFVFAPAARNGTPIAAKVLYRYKFSLPEPTPTAVQTARGAEAPDSSDTPEENELREESADGREGESGASEPGLDPEESGYETVVLGERRPEATAAAHYELEVGELRVVPRKNVTEQLMMAPGVLTTNHGGEGHAHETYMRGFASKEGQDIEFLVDGVPLNEVGNPHNHGYADLYLFPPRWWNP